MSSEEIDFILAKIKEQTDELKTLTDAVNTARVTNDIKSLYLTMDKLDEKIKTQQKENKTLEKKYGSIKKQTKKTQAKNKLTKTQIEELNRKNKIDTLKADMNKLYTEIKELITLADTLSEQLDEIDADLNNYLEINANTQPTIQAINSAIQEKSRKISSIQNKINLI